MLSEEEIIEEIKELIYNPNYDEILLCTEDGFTGWHELFENILDLYNKEKEKNKELEERLQEEINENCILKTKLYGESISKNKIREIVDIYDKSNCEIVKLPNGEQMCCSDSAELIEYLRELLEE